VPSGSILVPLALSCTMLDLFHFAVGMFEYETIGRRPGEKFSETLITPQEAQYVIPAVGGMYALITQEIQSETWPLLDNGYNSSDPVRWLISDDVQAMMAAL